MTETTASLIISLFATGKLSLRNAVTLYSAAGSACEVLENRNDIRSIVPDATDKLVTLMKAELSEYEKRAEQEEAWCDKNGIRILTYADKDYPLRLRNCFDAPLVLFVKGDCNLNASHIINIVGTRKCTPYGKDATDRIVRDLDGLCSDIMIVSGLAYGIDITAHRAAMNNSMPTVGVVAHGLDTIYPALHQDDAENIIQKGGAVVTEFFHGTFPEARNFLQRNRIIAGMSDATIVVESAAHGGGLVTARLAQDYNRDVLAVPGPINAESSQGCNNLIRDNKAALVSSAEDIVNIMMWHDTEKAREKGKKAIERTLFPVLTTDELAVMNVLKSCGDSHTSTITLHTGFSAGKVTAQLFSLEMKGLVTMQPGNSYHLIS